MARILCVTNDLVALLYSSIQLARRLEAAGHQVAFAGFPGARTAVEDHGFVFLPLEPNRYEDFLEEDAKRGGLERLRTVRRRRRQATDALGADSIVKVAREFDPDLVLIDGEMHEHIIAASVLDVPIALLNIFLAIWKRPGLPPLHHLVAPGVGWRGSRLGISLLWLNLRLKKRRTAWTQKLRRLGCDRLSVLRSLARDAGFDFRREVDFGQWSIPFTYRRLPTLTVHALEFEFPHTPRRGVHYLGPMVLDPRVEHRVTDEARAGLEAVFDCRRRARGSRKVIYAGFGSFFSTDFDFLRGLLAAVAGREDWDLVISLGGRAAREAVGDVPENVHVFHWVPQTEVLQHADVAVIHGGIGTVEECVCAEVPMLVYCGFETDMGGNTARVMYHGLGIVGNRRGDTPATMRGHIDRLLTEPLFADNLARMRCCYAAYTDHRVAERTIDSLLDS